MDLYLINTNQVLKQPYKESIIIKKKCGILQRHCLNPLQRERIHANSSKFYSELKQEVNILILSNTLK